LHQYWVVRAVLRSTLKLVRMGRLVLCVALVLVS